MSERQHAIQDICFDITLNEHKANGILAEFVKMHIAVQNEGVRSFMSKLRRTKSFKKSDAKTQQHFRRVVKAMARRPINYVTIEE